MSILPYNYVTALNYLAVFLLSLLFSIAAAGLSSNAGCIELRLDSCRMGPTETRHILKSVVGLKNLKTLILSRNRIDVEGANHLGQWL